MKTLVESLFDIDKNVKSDVKVDLKFVLDYIDRKIEDCQRKGISVEMDQDTHGDYIVTFWSPGATNANGDIEKININFVIRQVISNNQVVLILTGYYIYGINKSCVFMIEDKGGFVKNRYNISLNFGPYSIGLMNPNDQNTIKFLNVIDGFFDGFAEIHKNQQPVLKKTVMAKSAMFINIEKDLKKYFKGVKMSVRYH